MFCNLYLLSLALCILTLKPNQILIIGYSRLFFTQVYTHKNIDVGNFLHITIVWYTGGYGIFFLSLYFQMAQPLGWAISTNGLCVCLSITNFEPCDWSTRLIWLSGLVWYWSTLAWVQWTGSTVDVYRSVHGTTRGFVSAQYKCTELLDPVTMGICPKKSFWPCDFVRRTN